MFVPPRGGPPPLARITAIESRRSAAPAACAFVILGSAGGRVATVGGAGCLRLPACLAEMSDPADRRWRYPFLNCTECGPRFTITRACRTTARNTAMAGFPALPGLRGANTADPADRRFHAEPIACPRCGPQLRAHPASKPDAMAALHAGRIVALKGLGGFHLLCDATDADTVARLRAAKERGEKPFAVMALNAASAERWTTIGPAERAALESVERPIVLLRQRPGLPECAWRRGWIRSASCCRARRCITCCSTKRPTARREPPGWRHRARCCWW